MADLGSSLPVPVNQTKETKEMKLKWLRSAKQERISRINHLKQSIEDLLNGKVPEIERQILHAEQELHNLILAEEVEKRSIETEEIK
jgi:hypothetical protein